MLASYDASFVALSFAVATLASFTAPKLSSRILGAPNRTARWAWTGGGAVALGFGIWSMHFLGMLAMSMPFELTYDTSLTALSAVVAVLASGLALTIMGAERLTLQRLMAGGAVMGLAISGMHYTGMLAIPVSPGIRYDWMLVGVSVLVAVSASTVALWMVFWLARKRHKYNGVVHGIASLVLGAAICGMHYTGMAAATFQDGSVCSSGTALDKNTVGYGVSLVAVMLLVMALCLSILDRHLSHQRALTQHLSQENEALAHKAHHDHLTGLPNRAQLEERLAGELADAKGGGRELAVVFLDLDGFKTINDSAGHATGDMVLREIARRLATCTSQSGFVSRVSGDEFVLIIRGRAVPELQALCTTLLGAVQSQIELGGQTYRVSASIGVALQLSPEDDVRTLLSRADRAMYQAKKSGKNAFRLADNPQCTLLAKELELALRNREFELYFQPMVNARTLAIEGAEALVRWNHPRRGLFGPLEFIPAAEELGFIHELGNWILEEACTKLAEWRSEGLQQTLSVNLSAVQLENEALPGLVSSVVARHGVRPEQLILEVTETFAMTDIDRCDRVLSALTELGFTIAVDDFGTGYSSLSHLYRLPLGELKIDRSFVRTMADDERSAQICGAMVALAHSLKLTVVAEGVETHSQQLALVKLGCDFLQGYQFGKPMPWSELNGRIREAEERWREAA